MSSEEKEKQKLLIKHLGETDDEFYVVARRLHWKNHKAPSHQIIMANWEELFQKFPQFGCTSPVATRNSWEPLEDPFLRNLFF